MVWTRAVHSVTFRRKTLHSVGQNVTRNSVWHQQYRHFGLGKPSSPIARWIDIYVAPYNPQLPRIEPLINIGLLGSEALVHLVRGETRQSKLSRNSSEEFQDLVYAPWELCEIGKWPKSQSDQSLYSITYLNWQMNVLMRILFIELKAIYHTRSTSSAINAQVVFEIMIGNWFWSEEIVSDHHKIK